MQIPSKIQHGQKVISTVFDKINGIIDYLNASRVRQGPGIMVDETPSGTLVKLDPRARGTTIQQIIAGSTVSGLSATVSGGTATVEISGSTALVIEPGANIQITGGTNGELIISATGGGGSTGFPDYFSPNIVGNLDFNTIYGPYDKSVWLIGEVSAITDREYDELGGDLTVWIYNGARSKRIDIWGARVDPINTFDLISFGSFVCLPIPAGNTFDLHWVSAESDISDLKIYPCI